MRHIATLLALAVLAGCQPAPTPQEDPVVKIETQSTTEPTTESTTEQTKQPERAPVDDGSPPIDREAPSTIQTASFAMG